MFVAIALQAIPRATLEKKLDLKTSSRIDLVSNITGGALTLLLALKGAGVWSLVVGMLFTTFLKAVGLGLAEPYFRRPLFEPNRFRLEGACLVVGGGYLGLVVIHCSGDADQYFAGCLAGFP
jgi:O-antigen/teichoic acid export membrane protein